MNVLVIGGAGYVGQMIVPALKAHHRVRIFDLVAPLDKSLEFVQGTVTDEPLLLGATKGMNAVVYLAMGKDEKGNIDVLGPAYDVNVKGVHLACLAAVECGVRRFIYMSTLSVYADNGRRFFASEDEPPDARGVYGFTKALGEEVCRFFARVHGLDCLALRLNWPVPAEKWAETLRRHPTCAATSGDDLAQAVLAALECVHSGFDAIFISGDLEGRKTCLAKAQRILGWQPSRRA